MTDVFEQIRVSDIMFDTRQAYMRDVYGPQEWRQCITFLLDEEFQSNEIVEILRSKHMRWADDTRNWNLDEPTHAQCFMEYFWKYELGIWEDVKRWTKFT